MKKIFYFASVAAIVLSGCSKDDTEISPVDNGALSKIVATVEGNDTRTTLQDYMFVWSKGDAIGVFDENANRIFHHGDTTIINVYKSYILDDPLLGDI